MAITNAIMQMRRGNEADFNPENMREGEWAVSLDTKYVRMCFAPNVCIRMATYDAFEADMAQIRQILANCQSIQSAVEAIQSNIEGIEVVIEDYRNEATASATLSESYAVGGTGSRVGEDTDNALYYKEQARIYSERAEASTDIGIATTSKAGLVKPDGTTTEVSADGTISVIGGGGSSYEMLSTTEEVDANTEPGKVVDALAIKEVNSSLSAIKQNIGGMEVPINEHFIFKTNLGTHLYTLGYVKTIRIRKYGNKSLFHTTVDCYVPSNETSGSMNWMGIENVLNTSFQHYNVSFENLVDLYCSLLRYPDAIKSNAEIHGYFPSVVFLNINTEKCFCFARLYDTIGNIGSWDISFIKPGAYLFEFYWSGIDVS